MPTGQMSYEQALRIIGRYLDVEPAHHIKVDQVSDGFEVTSSPSEVRSEARNSRFNWDRLQDLYVFQISGRGGARKRHRHRGIWASVPGGHEDFFRALGYHMDYEGASDLHMEEMPESVSLSYQVPGSDGAQARQINLVLREGEIQEMLGEARDRRKSTLSGVPS
jgi:hypothetical protein